MTLQEFALDTNIQGEIVKYITNVLDNEVLQKAYGKQDVSGYAEAKQIILSSFIKLQNEYKPKPKIDLDSSM